MEALQEATKINRLKEVQLHSTQIFHKNYKKKNFSLVVIQAEKEEKNSKNYMKNLFN